MNSLSANRTRGIVASATGATVVEEPAVDYPAARAALRDVLARREFRDRHADRWQDAMRQRVTEWIASLLERLGVGPVAARTASVLSWAIALAALVVLVIWLLRLRRGWTAIEPALALGAPPRLSSREWAARARAALRDGDAREAIRSAYHAVLFQLEEQGVWRVDESRTPREYLSLLPARDSRRAGLIDLTRDFERAWYGMQIASVDDLPARLERLGCAL